MINLSRQSGKENMGSDIFYMNCHRKDGLWSRIEYVTLTDAITVLLDFRI